MVKISKKSLKEHSDFINHLQICEELMQLHNEFDILNFISNDVIKVLEFSDKTEESLIESIDYLVHCMFNKTNNKYVILSKDTFVFSNKKQTKMHIIINDLLVTTRKEINDLKCEF